MTQYRLVALEYRQEDVSASVCPTCGQDKPDVVAQVTRYRQGDVIDVTGAEEERLLAAGALAPVDETVDAEVVDDDPDVDKPDGDPDDVSGGDFELKRPRKAAPVDDWRAYAAAKGIDPEEAEGLTKAELIELLGEG